MGASLRAERGATMVIAALVLELKAGESGSSYLPVT